MSLMSRARTSFLAASAISLSALCLGVGPAAKAEPAGPWPSQVNAVYTITFNGFDIGSFEFSSAVSGSSYALSGDARLSALLGAFTWRGATRTTGVIAREQPRPAGYTFTYAGTGKSGSVQLGFAGDGIKAVEVLPVAPPSPIAVPVKDGHLKGVLDPLSAVMALARTAAANPCDRKLAIFDGKQRFDLLLSYKRQEHVRETRPSGQPGVAVVCRVRYQPIAGHKANEETRAMAAADGIEISLRPVPSANVFVPHQIVIPTGAGTVKLTASRIQIVTPRNEQIALGD